MPTLTTIADDWNIDYTNRIISHKDMTLSYDSNTGTAPSLGDYVRGTTTGAIGKVIGGSNLGGTNATGTLILTNVIGRFQDNESLDVLDILPFDTVQVGKGASVGDSLDGSSGTETFVIRAIEFNYGKQGVTAGEGRFYGTLSGTWSDNEQIDNTTTGQNNIALVNGSPTIGANFTGALVNEPTNGTGTPFSISGIINYDGGTEDIPNDALILAGVRATGTLTLTANLANNDTITLGSKTYTAKTTLTGAANEVLIGVDAATTIRNLVNAINGGAGEGTVYGNGTTPNTDATAVKGAGNTMIARAIIPSITTVTSTETSANASWTATTLNTGASGNTGRAMAHSRTLDSVTATGSYIVNDISGSFADNNIIYIDSVLNYDGVQTGQKFSVGDVIKGATTGARARVLAVTPTRLILAEQSLRFEDNEQIHKVAIDQSTTYIADVNGVDTHVSAVTVNHPNGQPCPRLRQQYLLQGGIYTNSINNVRHVRQLYNYLQDIFDEFDNFDDSVPMSGQVKNAQYTLINNWFIPDLSMRFLDSGSIRDSTSDNIWANPQSLGTMEAVGANGYGDSKVQPQLYIEQNGVVISPDLVPFLEGHINVLVKIKTNTDIKLVTATTGEGASIDNGKIRVYNRFYTHTYSHFLTSSNDTGGVVTIALATSKDLNNTTGTHQFTYTSGAGTWNVGEEIATANDAKVGVVISADSGATGTVTYVLKSGTNFASSDVVTGQYSRVSKTVNVVSNLVAGYSDKIGFGHVDSRFTGGTTTGTFYVGESVTQSGTGATGIFLENDNNQIYLDERTGTFNATGTLTGDISGATYTPTTRTIVTTAPKDIGDEADNNYSCVFGLDKTNSGSGRTIAQFYEYTKYLTAKESTILMGGRGKLTEVQGRLYRKVDQSDVTPTFAEQVTSPYGIKAGSLFIGAQSVFVEGQAAADLQNRQLVDNNGTQENPPNIQTLSVSGLAVGDKVVVFRTIGSGSTTILTNEFKVDPGASVNRSTDTAITVAANTRSVSPLPNDIPVSGAIRCIDPANAGLFLNFIYSSRSKASNTFTLAVNAEQPNGKIGDVTGGLDLTDNSDVYVTLLSETATSSTASKTIQYIGDINILTRVRKRGILPFEVTGVFGASGASVAAIRTTDPVVDPT
jgi:hypothetical protein